MYPGQFFPGLQQRLPLITACAFKTAHSKPSKPNKRWNFRKAYWSNYVNLTNKLVTAVYLIQHQTGLLMSLQANKHCSKERLPPGQLKNKSHSLPCWDAECERLCQRFFSYLKVLIQARLPPRI